MVRQAWYHTALLTHPSEGVENRLRFETPRHPLPEQLCWERRHCPGGQTHSAASTPRYGGIPITVGLLRVPEAGVPTPCVNVKPPSRPTPGHLSASMPKQLTVREKERVFGADARPARTGASLPAPPYQIPGIYTPMACARRAARCGTPLSFWGVGHGGILASQSPETAENPVISTLRRGCG